MAKLLEDYKCTNNESLKRKLMNCNMLVNKCLKCGIGPNYNNCPINLILDYINNNKFDTHPLNLRILCPNCYSQKNSFT